MTTEEFEKIALWMGWIKCQDHHGHYWGKGPNGDWCAEIETTSLEGFEVEALDRLVEKGYTYELGGSKYEGGHTLRLRQKGILRLDTDCLPTIHEAIEQALFQIAAKEG